MKNRYLHSIIPLAVRAFLLVAVVATTSSNASLVVDLGFDTSGASPDTFPSRTADISSGSEHTWNWDAGNLFYDGTDAWSQDIYAGISYTTYGGASFGGSTGGLTNIVDGGGTPPPDRVRAQASGTTGGSLDAGSQVNLLYLWDSANFLQSATSFSFDATADSSLSSSIYNVQLGPRSASHFVIRDGGTYYVSSASAGTAVGSTAISGDTAGLQWASFDPLLFASFNGDAGNIATSGFSDQTFSNVTGVGIIAFSERPNNAGSLFDLNGFQANLVAVPEPSTFALLSGLGALALIMLRRRRVS